ncbi:exonuclease [Gordonia phage Ayotoya]|uniref:Exonuclease n=5 Tax=Betterkatzvirus betterkatz TaxID=2560485 RepID=A0A2Z5HDA6_9CAUD|nr:exonuclease [Gordonia phage Nadeem]AZS11215.1 exonuclease [Gordonia phage WheatThin]QAU06845.1 exonuclease [Gordonia phage Brylie]QAX92543.1 exonuclease [Gordonia phage Mulch]QAY06504.1 exonuclease [Gordonia phage Parada]QSL99910.1 exonuclease [Gordonia phage Ayotoya]
MTGELRPVFTTAAPSADVLDRVVDQAAGAIGSIPHTPMPNGQQFFRVTDADTVRDELIGVIDWHARHHPRNLQKELGPSEVGHPCSRKLAYAITDAPSCNPGFDRLPSEIGIAYHDRLDKHFRAENQRIGRERWLTETTVEPWPGLWGSSDLFDVDNARVLDWKILGDSSMKKMQLHGPNLSYRRQLQFYGRGFERAGLPVKQVVLVAIPKAGTLRGTKVFVYDYDASVTERGYARWVQLLVMVDVLQVEHNPKAYAAFETVGENCQFCPWFKREPDDSGLQCGGAPDTSAGIAV